METGRTLYLLFETRNKRDGEEKKKRKIQTRKTLSMYSTSRSNEWTLRRRVSGCTGQYTFTVLDAWLGILNKYVSTNQQTLRKNSTGKNLFVIDDYVGWLSFGFIVIEPRRGLSGSNPFLLFFFFFLTFLEIFSRITRSGMDRYNERERNLFSYERCDAPRVRTRCTRRVINLPGQNEQKNLTFY